MTRSLRRMTVGLLAGLMAFAVTAISPMALASPIPYPTGPYDTVQNLVNGVITSFNTASTPQAILNTACSGTTTVTCPGLRLQLSYTGLTTAASGISAAQTVTDTSATASSQVVCQTTGYAGAGIPIIVNVVPSAGAFTYQVLNASTSAALNATVVSNCLVFN